MPSSSLPKLRDALLITDSNNITQYQIQSALDLRLESMDGDPRTLKCSVSCLPSPVRSSIYSDPGNVMLAHHLQRNMQYLTTILAVRAKSVPANLVNSTMKSVKVQQPDHPKPSCNGSTKSPRTYHSVTRVDHSTTRVDHSTTSSISKTTLSSYSSPLSFTGLSSTSRTKCRSAGNIRTRAVSWAQNKALKNSDPYRFSEQTTVHTNALRYIRSARRRTAGDSENVVLRRIENQRDLCRPLPTSYNHFLADITRT